MDFNSTNIPLHTNVIHKPAQKTLYPRKVSQPSRIPALHYDYNTFQSVCKAEEGIFRLTGPKALEFSEEAQDIERQDQNLQPTPTAYIAVQKYAFASTKQRNHQRDFQKTSLPFRPYQEVFSRLYQAEERQEPIKLDYLAGKEIIAPNEDVLQVFDAGKVVLPENSNIGVQMQSKLCCDEQVRKLSLRDKRAEDNPTILLSGSAGYVFAVEENGRWLAK